MKRTYTSAEVARLLGMSKSTVHRRAHGKSKRHPPLPLVESNSAGDFFDRKKIDALIAARQQQPETTGGEAA